ncbi:MAG TPA: response regulator [Bryobacteraceae bacterium]|nr:response regulator [Bryobacteraceae bacterium]
MTPTGPSHERTFEILLIEDNEADARLMKIAWAECAVVGSHVSLLQNSKDAIVYLRRAEPYTSAVRPDLIILDYKMPVDGGIALTEIKADPDYLHLPVVVLTGSSNPHDWLDCYRRHANCVYRKPSTLDDWFRLINHVAEHWFRCTVLPQPEQPGSPGFGS